VRKNTLFFDMRGSASFHYFSEDIFWSQTFGFKFQVSGTCQCLK
jgi:hypothetical protein